MSNADIIALPIAAIMSVVYQRDICPIKLSQLREHWLAFWRVVNNDYLQLAPLNVAELPYRLKTFIDVAFRLISYYDDGESFHFARFLF